LSYFDPKKHVFEQIELFCPRSLFRV
jgi:hypothetical protein